MVEIFWVETTTGFLGTVTFPPMDSWTSMVMKHGFAHIFGVRILSFRKTLLCKTGSAEHEYRACAISFPWRTRPAVMEPWTVGTAGQKLDGLVVSVCVVESQTWSNTLTGPTLAYLPGFPLWPSSWPFRVAVLMCLPPTKIWVQSRCVAMNMDQVWRLDSSIDWRPRSIKILGRAQTIGCFFQSTQRINTFCCTGTCLKSPGNSPLQVAGASSRRLYMTYGFPFMEGWEMAVAGQLHYDNGWRIKALGFGMGLIVYRWWILTWHILRLDFEAR